MTQLGHAQTEASARENTTARTAMWITVWSVVLALGLFCAVSAAMAETYTPHARRITSRYATAHFVGHRTSGHPRAAGGRSERTTAHTTPIQRSRRSSDRSPRFEPVRESVSSRRTSYSRRRAAAGARPAMHRVSGRRRHGERRGSDRMEVVAGSPRGYATGGAHAEENVSVAGSATSRSALPEVTASFAALPAVREPAALQPSGPSDLVGAPLTTTAGPEPRSAAMAADPDVSSATHAELAEEAGQPMVLPGLYRYGRLVVPPPMRGTREILMHQNLIADEEGLSRIQDDDDLRRMRTDRMLVDFPESMSLHVNPELAGDRRCARPWTVRFAADIARAYYARFHQPLQLNSAVRTVAYQLRLRRVNGNAAGIGGDMASPHLTGEALDFGKRDMSTEQIAWMRMYLRPLMQVGKVDVEEEFQQACFHISVYRSYAPEMLLSRRESAQLHGLHVTRARANEDQ